MDILHNEWATATANRPRETGSYQVQTDLIELAGPRIHVTIDPNAGAITRVSGRFDPNSPYSANLLSADGIAWRETSVLPTVEVGEVVHTLVSSSAGESSVECVIDAISADTRQVLTSTRWNLALDGHGVRVTTRVEYVQPSPAQAVVLDVSATQWLLAGFFDRGVVQQVRFGASGFASSDPLGVFYTVGNGVGSLAVVPEHTVGQSILTRDESRGTVGLQLVRHGSATAEDEWTNITWVDIDEGFHVIARPSVAAGDTFEATFTLFANDLPFPTHAIDPEAFSNLDDARTHYTAIYATSATTLGGYLIQGSGYPTILMPQRTYWTLHTFFDPDAWSTVSTLAFSGDPYLERETRRLIERSLGGILESGQVPHHFDGEEPLYIAISQAAQTGPNLFVTLASLDYVAGTGDVDFLHTHWSTLVRAIDWVLEFLDDDRKLLNVIGPLWVDVFKREGYTFDTNAATVYVLRRLADAAAYMGRPDLVSRYQQVIATIVEGIEALWDVDHYITARGKEDWDDIHDMVDSESYLAIAFEVADPSRYSTIIERMDRVPNMHPGGKGTWVSEVYYGPEFCHLENTGDSKTAMARLWWGDLLARYVMGDAETFTRMFEAVRADQFELTWMRERYGAEGTMIRAIGYHEYPEILDKMLREGYYGLALTLVNVVVRPLLVEPFRYDTGRITLDYSADRVRVLVPGDGTRTYTIGGLSGDYRVNGTTVTATDGTVVVDAPAGIPLELTRA